MWVVWDGRKLENFLLRERKNNQGAKHAEDTDLLLMTFKRRRRANTAKPTSTAMPIFLTSCNTEMHVWKYGRELIVLTCIE